MQASEIIVTLAESMRQSTAAVAQRDLPRLEEILCRQQALLAAALDSPGSVREFLRQRPDLALDLATQAAIFARVIRRTSGTLRALFSLTRNEEPLYSLDTLPRR